MENRNTLARDFRLYKLKILDDDYSEFPAEKPRNDQPEETPAENPSTDENAENDEKKLKSYASTTAAPPASPGIELVEDLATETVSTTTAASPVYKPPAAVLPAHKPLAAVPLAYKPHAAHHPHP